MDAIVPQKGGLENAGLEKFLSFCNPTSCLNVHDPSNIGGRTSFAVSYISFFRNRNGSPTALQRLMSTCFPNTLGWCEQIFIDAWAAVALSFIFRRHFLCWLGCRLWQFYQYWRHISGVAHRNPQDTKDIQEQSRSLDESTDSTFSTAWNQYQPPNIPFSTTYKQIIRSVDYMSEMHQYCGEDLSAQYSSSNKMMEIQYQS
jgi:hypothetical protein